MNQLIRFSRFCYRPSLGLLLIRVAVGAIFMHHGFMKYQNIAGTVGFMGTLGIPAPLTYIAIFTELVGGAMIILGVFTRVAAVGTGIVALVAFQLAVAPKRGFAGGEFELLLAAVSFGLALIGSGRCRLANIFEHDQK